MGAWTMGCSTPRSWVTRFSISVTLPGRLDPRPGSALGRTGYLCVMDLLTDLQVVDCSSGIPGGYCAKLLGDAGAEVIKVEAPDGDPLRRWTNQGYWAGVPGGGDGALFQFLHFGHRSVIATTVDEIGELLAGADVLITDAHGIASDP